MFCHKLRKVQLDWNDEKNTLLKKERGVSFEDVKVSIETGNTLDTYNHPNQTRYPGQKIIVIKIDNYAYLVPYIENKDKIFLKTIIPSRIATKKYLTKNKK